MSDDRIGAEVFAKLRATWGTRFLALWRGVDMGEVLSTWNDALAGVDRDRIHRALVDCQNAENPPTLPDFLRLCRQQSAPRDQPRLTWCGPETTREQARENLGRVHRMLASIGRNARRDPMFWARRPQTNRAVQLLARGATTDHRLRAILFEHIAEGGTRCRSEEAVQSLLALMDSGVIDRLRGLDEVPAYEPPREPGEDDEIDSRAPAHFAEPAGIPETAR